MSNNADDDRDSSNPPPILIPTANQERTRYRKEKLLNQFSKLLQSSLTVDQVCDYFQITRSSYYRWLRKLEIRDGKFMEKHQHDHLIFEVNNTAELFKKIVFNMNSIMTDKEADSFARIDAAKLAGEVQLGLLDVYKKGPAAAWTSLPLPVKRVITETYQPQQPKLLDKRSKQEDALSESKQEQGERTGLEPQQ